MVGSAVELHWIPLGAGGHIVRFNGLVYEAVHATIDRRPRCDLYHSALTIRTRDQSFAVEMTPIPDLRGCERGVVAEGPVGARWAGRLRIFRYEIRCWPNGTIPDLSAAVASPVRITDDPTIAEHIMNLLPDMPTPTWGRDELGTGEMWCCNSVTAWVLTRALGDISALHPPAHGRAPGWHAGRIVAERLMLPASGREAVNGSRQFSATPG